MPTLPEVTLNREPRTDIVRFRIRRSTLLMLTRISAIEGRPMNNVLQRAVEEIAERGWTDTLSPKKEQGKRRHL